MSKPIETITAEDLYFTPVPQRENEMIVEDMIPQGLTILAGPPKVCKSWLVLDMGVAVASGAPLLGKRTLGCGVLYFALEDRAASLQKRLHALEMDEPPDNLYLATSCPPLGQELYASLNEYLREHPDIRLIIIDTLQMIRKGDGGSGITNQYGKDTNELSTLKKYADNRNLAIVIVHHVTKRVDPHDPVNDIRGSSGMSAAPDSIMILRKDRAEKNGELLCVSREFPQWKMRLRFEHFRWQIQGLITEEEMQKEAIPEILFRIAEMIKECGRWDGTMSELLAEVGETEMTSNVLSRKVAQHGGSIFGPEHIEVRQRRTSRVRQYTFIYRPEGADGMREYDEIPMCEISSLSSSSSQMTDAQRRNEVERARQTILLAGGVRGGDPSSGAPPDEHAGAQGSGSEDV